MGVMLLHVQQLASTYLALVQQQRALWWLLRNDHNFIKQNKDKAI